MLRRLAHEQHKSILLSTHDVELALQLSDRLWLMEESRFSIGTPKELAADGSLSRFINRDGIRFNKDSLRIEIKWVFVIDFFYGRTQAHEEKFSSGSVY